MPSSWSNRNAWNDGEDKGDPQLPLGALAKLALDQVELKLNKKCQGLYQAAAFLAANHGKKQGVATKHLNRGTKMMRALQDAAALERHLTTLGLADWMD